MEPYIQDLILNDSWNYALKGVLQEYFLGSVLKAWFRKVDDTLDMKLGWTLEELQYKGEKIWRKWDEIQ